MRYIYIKRNFIETMEIFSITYIIILQMVIALNLGKRCRRIIVYAFI